MTDHECHLGRCNGIGGNNEIAFILTVLGVEDDYEFAISCPNTELTLAQVTPISDCMVNSH
jgi:hypothetical protein